MSSEVIEKGGEAFLPACLTLDNAANVSTILASIAVCVTARFIWKQMRLQSSANENAQRVFTRESAKVVFETLHSAEFKSSRRVMLDCLNKKITNPDGREQLDAFRFVLNTYEMLALQVKLDAVDEGVWRLYWKRALLRDWERLEEFITKERERFAHPTLFIDAEELKSKWAQNE